MTAVTYTTAITIIMMLLIVAPKCFQFFHHSTRATRVIAKKKGIRIHTHTHTHTSTLSSMYRIRYFFPGCTYDLREALQHTSSQGRNVVMRAYDDMSIREQYLYSI